MIRFIKDWWYRRLRRIDMEVLWPSCKSETPDLHMAKAAFAVHCFNDPAWMWLGHDEVYRFIDELEGETDDLSAQDAVVSRLRPQDEPPRPGR